MTIGIDLRPFSVERKSGVEGYIANLLESLFKIDKKSSYKLFCNSFEKNNSAQRSFEKIRNVEIFDFNYPNKVLNFCFKYLKYPEIDRMIEGADIFFQPNLLFQSCSQKCKKVLTFHDLSFITHAKCYSWKRRLWHKFINAEYIARQADGIIAVSESTKNDIVDIFGIKQDKIRVIHSGINEYNNFNPLEQKRVIQKYQLPAKYFLYLGVLEPRKNIISIITAFEKFKQYKQSNHKLVLAGSKGWLSKKIIDNINTSKYKKDIILLGFVDEKWKKYLYKMADIFIFPSFYEGFGFPPLEAMAAGTPVITSSTSSLSEICGKAAVYVDPYNINEIFMSMLTIGEDYQMRADLIKAGNVQIKKFIWENSAEETLNFFKHVINN